jgi:hypothetical protein
MARVSFLWPTGRIRLILRLLGEICQCRTWTRLAGQHSRTLRALPGLSDDAFSEVTALQGILLRGCLNLTEGGLGDESFIQHGPRYIEIPGEIPLPLWHGTKTRLATRTNNYTNYITIISLTSGRLPPNSLYFLTQDYGAYPSLANPRRRGCGKPNWGTCGKPNWGAIMMSPQFGFGSEPKWEGPKPK